MTAHHKVDPTALAALVADGKTTPQLAQHFGVSESTIARHRAALGISAPRLLLTPERLATIETMLDDGLPFREIQRTEGADMATLRKYFPGRQWTTEQTREHIAAVRPIYRQLRRAERMQALARTYGNAA